MTWTFYVQLGAQISDNFSDFELQSNPTWGGDTSCFYINSDTILQLNAPINASNCFITTPSQAIGHATYQFDMELQFNPSPSNYARVYLTSSSGLLNDSLHGYFVQIGGETGNSDDVSLFYQNGLTITKIIDGLDGLAAFSPKLGVRVSRDMVGNWELLVDTNQSGGYISQGVAFHDVMKQAGFFGFDFHFTTTRRDKFFVDNVVVTGGIYQDFYPPIVTDIQVAENDLTLFFDEPLNPIMAQMDSNYWLNASGLHLVLVTMSSDQKSVELFFDQPFNNLTDYALRMANVEDTSGNVMQDTLMFFTTGFAESWRFGDVVINEIYADPEPSNGLPISEYIELRNNSSFPVLLNGFTISDLNDTCVLDSVILHPNALIMVCDEKDTLQWLGFEVMGVSGFPSLNNSGDSLVLTDSFGNKVDKVNYQVNWHDSTDFRNGGWSLEKTNPFSICGANYYWGSSISVLGGTPGKENSIVDTLRKEMEVVVREQNKQAWNVFFSKPFLDAGEVVIGELPVKWYPVNSLNGELLFDAELDRGEGYLLEFDTVVSCVMDTDVFFQVENYLVQSHDILINEILFNSYEDGKDFVELYNRTSYPIDLAGYGFIETNTLGDSTIWNVEHSFILPPQEYVFISEDTNNVVYFYPEALSTHKYQMDLPSWNDDGGELVFVNSYREIMDMAFFEEDMHSEFLEDVNGVSLERVNHFPEINPQKVNWHSAGSTADFATPGKVNSQFFSSPSKDLMEFNATTITPNNDGVDDALIISISLNQSVWGSLDLFDWDGNAIKQLVSSETFGLKNQFIWKGKNQLGSIVSSGLYVVVFHGVDELGNQLMDKKTVAVYVE